MTQIKCYERMEIAVEKNITHVTFTYSDGSFDTVYPFYDQPIDISYDVGGIESIEKKGEIYNCVRYTPCKEGSLCVRIFDGEKTIQEYTVCVLKSECHGYIKPSDKDKRYLEYTDGTPFVPIALNMVYPNAFKNSTGHEFCTSETVSYIGLNQYKSWFKKCSENGVNVVRLWLGTDYFTPDTENAYEYDLTKFALIDRVVELAKEYGLALKLTIEHFRNFKYGSDLINGCYVFMSNLFSKSLYLDGVRCENTKEWLSDIKWQKAWLHKVGELAKRLSGDTAVYAIELWNEMNCVEADYSDILAWNEKVLPEVKKLFPKNMVINSLGSLDSEYANNMYRKFCWDKCDIIQIHRYLDIGAKNKACNENPIEFVKDAFELVSADEKPVILAETGAVEKGHSGPFKYYISDDDGLIFADCVYTPLFVGSAGSGQIWHWDHRYVEAKSLYKMYRPITALLSEVDVLKQDLKPADISTDKAYVLVLEGKDYILGYVRNKTSSWKNILRDLNDVEIINELSVKLDGIKGTELIKIWSDDSSMETDEDMLIFKNVAHGLMFKCEKVKK